MDLRIQKTRSAIRNAFIQLRAHRSLEQISVKELTGLAMISKGTFYLHYHDIYDLSESLQQEVISSIIDNIGHPDSLLYNPAVFMEELVFAFHNQQGLIDILFAGDQSSVIPKSVEKSLRGYLAEHYPETGSNAMLDILLTFEVEGAFAAFADHSGKHSYEEVIRALTRAVDALLPLYS